MIKVLVTGAAGQLGQSFASIRSFAEEKGLDLLLLDRDALDITCANQIASVLDALSPQVLINAAAYTAVDRAEQEQERALKLNADAAGLLAEACAQRDVWMLQVSTDYVFDGKKTAAYLEDDPVAPLGVYGRTKLLGEQRVLSAADTNLVLRTSWVFSEFGQNFLKTMLRLGAERDQLGVVADQHGGPTYAPHIARVLLQLIDLKLNRKQILAGGVYHFAGQPIVSWYEFATEIFAALEQQGLLSRVPKIKAITTQDYPTPAQRPANSALAVQKLDSVLGSELLTDWRLGVLSALQALQPKNHH